MDCKVMVPLICKLTPLFGVGKKKKKKKEEKRKKTGKTPIKMVNNIIHTGIHKETHKLKLTKGKDKKRQRNNKARYHKKRE